MIKPFSFFHITISGVFLGIGSYFHELPHVLSKVFLLFIPIFVYYILSTKYEIKRKILISFSSGLIIFFVPIVILLPYIVRNYIIFGRYIETRYWGVQGIMEQLSEFDNNLVYFNDLKTDEYVAKIIKNKKMKIDRTMPEYFDVLNFMYDEYISNKPFVRYYNALKRIPKLLKARQFYGVEVLGDYRKFNLDAMASEKKSEKYSTFDYFKKYPFSFMVFIELVKFIFDNIILMISINFILIYNIIKTKNLKLSLIFMIVISLYSGNLFNHVEPKYFIIAYLITFIHFIILLFNYINGSDFSKPSLLFENYIKIGVK
ncbi:MAG TPA: hypothetical protein PKL57_07740 [Candidatus Wallbacteria bacterium]|nr:hypothetical protein [Candidatus Wallbacteria bacterium]